MTMNIGLVGLGMMGSAFANNLIRQGHRVFGFDIEPDRNRWLSGHGGIALSCATEVAETTEFIITSLPSDEALLEVLDGTQGLLARPRTGQIIIETSTLSLKAKEQARDITNSKAVTMLDCPVSGTSAQAVQRDLAIYASGNANALEKCHDLFRAIARSVHFVGPFGNGTRMKFIANLLVAIHNLSAAEAFVLGQKSGLDPKQVYEVIKDGAGTSRMFEVRGPMMAEKRYDEPTMRVDLWQKDMRLISEYVRAVDCPTPLFLASVPYYTAAQAAGWGNKDTASVCAILERLGNLEN